MAISGIETLMQLGSGPVLSRENAWSYRGRMRGEYSRYADVMAQMRRSVLTIPLGSPRSPFSISPQC